MKTNQNAPAQKGLITIPVKAVTTLEYANRAIARNNEHLRSYVQAKLQEFGMSQPFCELRFGLFPVSAHNPYDEIINISAGIHNALRDGWFFFFEAERLRRELAELKGRPVEAVEYKVIDQK